MQVLPGEPCDVAGDVHEGFRHPAFERVFAEHDLFVRAFRIPGMDRRKDGLGFEDRVDLGVGGGNSLIVPVPIIVVR